MSLSRSYSTGLLRDNFSSGVLVCEGDSLTHGDGGLGTSYPAVLEGYLGTARWALSNVSTAGQTLVTMTSDAAAQVDALYDGAKDYNICCIWGGTNDIAQGADAATTYSRLHTYCEARKAVGWTVVTFTLTPAAGGAGAGFNTTRGTFNTTLKGDHHFCDVLVDLAADPDIGPDGAETNTTYYTDLLHMTAAGYTRVANLTYNALKAVVE